MFGWLFKKKSGSSNSSGNSYNPIGELYSDQITGSSGESVNQSSGQITPVQQQQ